jgi:hypothetical protein
MRIIVSAGFPYPLHVDGGNYIHAEEQGDDIFVSEELVKEFQEYFIQKEVEDIERRINIERFERFVLLHRDHTAVYSSSNPKDERQVKDK